MDVLSQAHFDLALRYLKIAHALVLKQKNIRLRRWWTKPLLKQREILGAYKAVFLYLKLNDQEKFCDFGMNVSKFEYLHNLVKKKLQKHSYRSSLQSELKLSAVLNFLRCGGNVRQLSLFFFIGRSTMYRIIPEFCKVLCTALRSYISLPDVQKFEEIANEFLRLYDFPHCIGILDGKHVPIKSAPKSGSSFRYYKKGYSINIMTARDAQGKIIYMSVGDFGSKNDAGNFMNSTLGIRLAKGDIKLPCATKIPHSNVYCSFFFIADGGFGLHEYLITPYRAPKVGHMLMRQKLFNIRLQNPRKIIERVFGILCKQYQILETKLDFKMRTIDVIVIAIRYNFTLQNDDAGRNVDINSDVSSSKYEYIYGEQDESTNSSVLNSNESSDTFSRSESCSSEISTDTSIAYIEDAEGIRNYLSKHFMSSSGNVVWQWTKLLE